MIKKPSLTILGNLLSETIKFKLNIKIFIFK